MKITLACNYCINLEAAFVALYNISSFTFDNLYKLFEINIIIISQQTSFL